MNNTLVCPVDNRRINEKVARINASLTLFIVFIGLYYQTFYLVLFVAIDFFLRIIFDGKYSPLSNINKLVLEKFKIKPTMINAAPKIFAAKMGLGMTIVASTLLFFELNIAAYIIGGLIVLFAFLESVFGFCIACKVYPILYRNL